MPQAISREVISVILVTIICLTCSYDLQCPDPSHWKLRAIAKCGNITTYKCLYDDNNGYYVENCTRPDIEAPGYKLVWRRNLDRALCKKNRYQPFIFYTDETSDCSLQKSKCNGEGQLVYDRGKTSEDIQCRCNFTLGYAFVYKPIHPCFCVPSTEDCSCYRKTCRELLVLSQVYVCHEKNQFNPDDSCLSSSNDVDTESGDTGLPRNDSTLPDYITIIYTGDRKLRKIAAYVLACVILGVVLPTIIYTCVCKDVTRRLEQETYADETPSTDGHQDSRTEWSLKVLGKRKPFIFTDVLTDERDNTPRQTLSTAAMVHDEKPAKHDDYITNDYTHPKSYVKFDILLKNILLQRKSKSGKLNIIIKCEDEDGNELFELLQHILDQDLSVHGNKIMKNTENKTRCKTEDKTENKRKFDFELEKAARNAIQFLREEPRDVKIRYVSSDAVWLILKCHTVGSVRDIWRKCSDGKLKLFLQQCICGRHCEVLLNEDEYVMCINEFDSQEKAKLKEITRKDVQPIINDFTFVETHTLTQSLKVLREKGVVVLIGVEGSGKSRNAYELMNIFKKENKLYSLLKLKSLHDWDKFVDPDEEVLVLLDDIFGRTNCSYNEETDREVLNRMVKCLKLGYVKIIITLRDKIKMNCKRLFEEHSLFKHDLIVCSQNSVLNIEHKKAILQNYLKKNNIDVRDPSDVIQKGNIFSEDDTPIVICQKTVDNIIQVDPVIGFPQACYLFTKYPKYTRLGVNFFKHPSEYVRDEIEDLRKRGKKETTSQIEYAVLVYTILNGGTICTHSINVEAIARVLESIYGKQKYTLKESDVIDSIDGLRHYLIPDHKASIYRFQHQILAESVLISYGTFAPKYVIPILDLDFIIEMIRTTDYEVKDGEVVLKIKSEHYTDIAERCFHILRNDYAHRPFDFVKIICQSHIAENASIGLFEEIINYYIQNTPTVESCTRGKHDERIKLNQIVQTSCEFCLFYLPTFALFHLVFSKSNSKVVENLIEKLNNCIDNGDIVVKTECKTTFIAALLGLCSYGTCDIVHRILTIICNHDIKIIGKMPASETLMTAINISQCMFLAYCSGNIPIVEYLWGRKDQESPFRKSINLKHVLETTYKLYTDDKVSMPDPPVAPLQWLLDNVDHTLFQTKELMGKACRSGWIQVVECLIKNVKRKDILDLQNGMNQACLLAKTEVVKQLLNTGIEFDMEKAVGYAIDYLELNVRPPFIYNFYKQRQTSCNFHEYHECLEWIVEHTTISEHCLGALIKVSCKLKLDGLIKLLINKKQTKDFDMAFIINSACLEGNYEIVKWLWLNVCHTNGKCEMNDRAFFKWLMECSHIYDVGRLIYESCKNGKIDWLQKYCNANSKDIFKITAIYKLACRDNRFLIIKWLLQTFDKTWFEWHKALDPYCMDITNDVLWVWENCDKRSLSVDRVILKYIMARNISAVEYWLNNCDTTILNTHMILCALVKEFPFSATCNDNNSVLHNFIRTCIENNHVKRNWLLIEACTQCNLQLVKWLTDNYQSLELDKSIISVCQNFRNDYTIYRTSDLCNRKDILEVLLLQTDCSEKTLKKAMDAAYKSKQFDLLELLCSKGKQNITLYLEKHDCLNTAIRNGHIDLVENLWPRVSHANVNINQLLKLGCEKRELKFVSNILNQANISDVDVHMVLHKLFDTFELDLIQFCIQLFGINRLDMSKTTATITGDNEKKMTFLKFVLEHFGTTNAIKATDINMQEWVPFVIQTSNVEQYIFSAVKKGCSSIIHWTLEHINLSDNVYKHLLQTSIKEKNTCLTVCILREVQNNPELKKYAENYAIKIGNIETLSLLVSNQSIDAETMNCDKTPKHGIKWEVTNISDVHKYSPTVLQRFGCPEEDFMDELLALNSNQITYAILEALCTEKSKAVNMFDFWKDEHLRLQLLERFWIRETAMRHYIAEFISKSAILGRHKIVCFLLKQIDKQFLLKLKCDIIHDLFISADITTINLALDIFQLDSVHLSQLFARIDMDPHSFINHLNLKYGQVEVLKKLTKGNEINTTAGVYALSLMKANCEDKDVINLMIKSNKECNIDMVMWIWHNYDNNLFNIKKLIMSFISTRQYKHKDRALKLFSWLWEKARHERDDISTYINTTCTTGNVFLAEWIIEQTPKTCIVPEDIIDECCESWSIKIFMWLWNNSNKSLFDIKTKINSLLNRIWTVHGIYVALEWLSWLWDKVKHEKEDITTYINTACKAGNAVLAEWIMEHVPDNLIVAEEIIDECCKSRNTKIVMWLWDNYDHSFFDIKTKLSSLLNTNRIYRILMGNNVDLEWLAWLWDKVNHEKEDITTYINTACKAGNTIFAEWIMEHVPENLIVAEGIIDECCKSGSAKMIMWLWNNYDLTLYDIKTGIKSLLHSRHYIDIDTALRLLSWLWDKVNHDKEDVTTYINIACKNDNTLFAQWIIEHVPENLIVAEDIIDECCKSGSMEICLLLWDNYNSLFNIKCSINSLLNTKHHIDSEKTLRLLSLLWDKANHEQDDISTYIESAFKSGNKCCVEWIIENMPKNLKLSEDIIQKCCKSGSITMLRWIWDNYDRSLFDIKSRIKSLLNEKHHFDMDEVLKLLAWLWDKVNHDSDDISTYIKTACLAGNTFLAEWIMYNMPKNLKLSEDIIEEFCKSGSINMYRWLWDNYDHSLFDIKTAIKSLIISTYYVDNKTLKLLSWLWDKVEHERNDITTYINTACTTGKAVLAEWITEHVQKHLIAAEDIMEDFCKTQSIKLAKILFSQTKLANDKFITDLMMIAFQTCNAQIAKLLWKNYDHGLFDVQALMKALLNSECTSYVQNALELLSWLWDKVTHEGDDISTYITTACKAGNVFFAEWIMTHVPQNLKLSEGIIDVCCKSGSIPVLRWLWDNYDHSLIDIKTAIMSQLNAEFYVDNDESLELLSWLWEKVEHERNDITTYINTACKTGKAVLAEWIIEHVQKHLISVEDIMEECCKTKSTKLAKILFSQTKDACKDKYITDLMLIAFRTCNAQIAKLLWKNYDHGLFDVQALMKALLNSECTSYVQNALELLSWLWDKVTHEGEDISTYINTACKAGNVFLAEWIMKHVPVNLIVPEDIMDECCKCGSINMIMTLLSHKDVGKCNLRTAMNNLFHQNWLTRYMSMLNAEICSRFALSIIKMSLKLSGKNMEDNDPTLLEDQNMLNKFNDSTSENRLQAIQMFWERFDKTLFDMDMAMQTASKHGSSKLITWLIENVKTNYIFEMNIVFFEACRHLNYEVVHWVVDNNDWESYDLPVVVRELCGRTKNDMSKDVIPILDFIWTSCKNKSLLAMDSAIQAATECKNTAILQWWSQKQTESDKTLN